MATAPSDSASSRALKYPTSLAEPRGKWGATRPSGWVYNDEKIYRVARSANRLSIINDVEFRRLIKTLDLDPDGLIICKSELIERDIVALRDLQSIALEAAKVYEENVKLRWDERGRGAERVVLCLADGKEVFLSFNMGDPQSRLNNLLNEIRPRDVDLADIRVVVSNSGPDWGSTKADFDTNVIWVDEFSGQIESAVFFYLMENRVDGLDVAAAADQLIEILNGSMFQTSIQNAHLDVDILGYQPHLLSPSTSSWLARYWVWTRLLKISTHLRKLSVTWIVQFSEGKKDSDEYKMMERIYGTGFWRKLENLCTHLKPLAMAANAGMSHSSAPDRVLLTFRWLAQQYHEMRFDTTDAARVKKLLAYIQDIWARCDQDLYIAAIGLHPFHRTKMEKDAELLALVSEEEYVAVCMRLYTRLMREDPPAAFEEDVRAWMSGRNLSGLSDIKKHTRSVQREAKRKGKYPDALDIWARICPNPKSAFERFATSVLSIPAIDNFFTGTKLEAMSAQLYPFVRRGQMSAILERTMARSGRAPSIPPRLAPAATSLQEAFLRFRFYDRLIQNHIPATGRVPLRGREARRSVTLQRDFGPALEHGFKEQMAWYDLLALGSQPSPYFDLGSGDIDFDSEAESDDEICDAAIPLPTEAKKRCHHCAVDSDASTPAELDAVTARHGDRLRVVNNRLVLSIPKCKHLAPSELVQSPASSASRASASSPPQNVEPPPALPCQVPSQHSAAESSTLTPGFAEGSPSNALDDLD
ncbi:hypothetical protein FA95DRAFT_503833 [Auriscalpium vulgare]|uniref:Uncharacterized protein n=1 Tax=Auriscalpium vulgare TaxID=40419 RepID=A0ACB8RH82_9AGAM|nr:hypothetical protein FA95DRAFT_503833 [Auriscalpium vulgare]